MVRKDFILDERTLPLTIQKDIKALVEYQNSNERINLDLYWGELYGSINSSQHGREITKEIADYLREKYLGI
ncbi:hypothetical protein GZ989_011420 (plasmid) [Campylobacter fetus]|uniref:Uncharacterized protein n=1 Tax=Campylobacter fetus TaxID=196 RepID=A0A974MV55_CAMFE|nr:hypothetical protein [Campylobacter fetus]OCS32880.1 hypothetical protein AWR31_08035 [Campylobacter fetus subsp. venerealis]QMS59882.1 hypothetical protein GZ989_011420 [Campylobacter fetus]